MVATCRVQYDTFVSSPITNNGLEGAAQNGVAVGTYGTLGSGATYIDFSGTSSRIRIPSCANITISTIHDFSLEFGFQFNGAGSGSVGRLFHKPSFGGVYVDATNKKIWLYRAATNGFDYWVTPACLTTLGGWYEVQMSWATGTGPASAGTPIFRVNDIDQVMTHVATGSGAWYSDAGSDAYVGNDESFTNNLNGKLTIFRMYMGIVTSAVFSANYAADNQRWITTASPIKAGMQFSVPQPHVYAGTDILAQPTAAVIEAAVKTPTCTVSDFDFVIPDKGRVEIGVLAPTVPISVQTCKPAVAEIEVASMPLQIEIDEWALPDCATIEAESPLPDVIVDFPSIVDLDGTVIDYVELDAVLTDSVELDAVLVDSIELEAQEEYE